MSDPRARIRTRRDPRSVPSPRQPSRRKAVNMTTNELDARHGEVVARVLLAAKAVAQTDAAVKLGDPLTNERALEERDEALDMLHVAVGAYELLHGPLAETERASR